MTEVQPSSAAGRPRVLLDESVPHDLLLHLGSLDVTTVQALGWAGIKNGALLQAAREAGYHVLITVDRRMEYQQNISASRLALVVLRARSSRMIDLLPLVPRLLESIIEAKAGQVTHVAA